MWIILSIRSTSVPVTCLGGGFLHHIPHTHFYIQILMECLILVLGSPGIDYYILYNMKLPFSDGSLGSRNDEERRETRYVM